MALYKIDKSKLIEETVKTTPQLVDEANLGLFRAKMTLPAAAKTLWHDEERNEDDILGIFEV